MNWDVYTLGGGAYLQVIFNSIAAICGDGNYMTLLKMAMLIGVLITLVRSAYRGQMFDFQWFLGATMGYYVAFLPTATVIITDNLDPSQSSVVANVPIGLAATAGIANEVGWWLTTEYDTMMALPADITYDQHGMLFGNTVVQSAMEADITDPRTAGNLSEFFQQCVFYDILLGKYALNDLQTAPDLWAFIQTNTSVARAFSYQPAAGPAVPEICITSAKTGGDLDNDLQAALPQTLNVLGQNNVNASTRNAAIATYEASMPVAYQYFSGLAGSASQIVEQAALSNAMKRGISDWASRTNASAAAQDYAAAIAEQQAQSGYAVIGRLSQKLLPMLNNLLKAGIYALFPIVFALGLLPNGWKIALMYCKAMIWVELWSPLFAIIHFLATLTTASHAQSAVTLGDGTQVLSMVTYGGLAQVMADYSVIAGYFTMLVPPIAWGIVAGGGAALASAATSILSSYASAAQQASGEATRGNLSLDNTNFGNAKWWQQNEAPSKTLGRGSMTGPDGVERTITGGGEFDRMPQSSLPVSAQLENSTRAALSRGYSNATREAYSQTTEAASRMGRALRDVESLGQELSNNKDFRDGVSSSSAADFQQSSDHLFKLIDMAKEGTSYSRSQAASLLLQTGLGGHASLPAMGSEDTPGLGLIGGNLSVGGQLNNQDKAGVEKFLQNARDLGLDKSFGDKLSHVLRAGSELSATYSGSDSKTYANTVRTELGRDASITESASTSIEKAHAYEEAQRLSQESGFGSRIQLDDRFLNWLSQDMGGRNAAEDLIRRGAQIGDAASLHELQTRMSLFAKLHSEDIARSAAVAGSDSTSLWNQYDVSAESVRDRGAGSVASLDADGHSRIHNTTDGAEQEQLTTTNIDSRVDALRVAGHSEHDEFERNEQERAGQDGIARASQKDKIDKEREFDVKAPLTLQALGTQRIDTPGGNKPIVSVPHIQGEPPNRSE